MVSSCVLLLIVVAVPGLAQPAPDSGWIDLTAGGLEEGWRQLGGAAEYTLEDGVVVGTAVIETPNSFLATEKEYGDFALQLEFKIDEGLNAGVQIRSHSDPAYRNGTVHGYQVEIDPSERAWSAGVYDEARRGWLYPLAANPAASQAFRQGGWNHLYIEAIGPEIRTWLNNVPATFLIDEMTASGFIALQVHSVGPEQGGLQVRYRNVWLRTEGLTPSGRTFPYIVDTRPNELSEAAAAQGWRLLFDGESTEAWRGAHREDFPEAGWAVRDGELTVLASEPGAERGGGIVTRESFSAFELQLEFRMTEGANSGIKYLVTEGYDSAPGTAVAFEYQIPGRPAAPGRSGRPERESHPGLALRLAAGDEDWALRQGSGPLQPCPDRRPRGRAGGALAQPRAGAGVRPPLGGARGGDRSKQVRRPRGFRTVAGGPHPAPGPRRRGRVSQHQGAPPRRGGVGHLLG